MVSISAPSIGDASAVRPEPLRLGYVIDTLLTGGAERLVLTFAEVVRNRDDVDLTVFVLSDLRTPFYEALEALGTEIVTLPGRNLVDMGRFARLIGALRAHRIEHVHAHLASSTTIGAFAARALGIPFVTTIHNVRPSVRRIRTGRKFLQWAALRLPGVKVIAVGKAVADAMKGRNCVVVPNAVSETVVAPRGAREAVRASLNLSDDAPVLVCVGTIIGQKAHNVLLDSFALVRQRNDKAQLLIVGDARDPERQALLEQQAAMLKITDSLHFLGMRRDIPDILAASDLFVSSSDWEGAPVSLLEAMANGLPAVVTDVGENDLVLRQTGAVLVPIQDPQALAEGILSLIDDPEKRSDVAQAVQQRALSEYGAEAWVNRLLDFYADTGRRRDWRDGGRTT